MKHRNPGTSAGRGRPLGSLAASLVLAGGVVTVGVGLQGDASAEPAVFQSSVAPSEPPTVVPNATATVSAVPAPPEPAHTKTPPAPDAPVGPVLPASEPVSTAIETIGVNSALIPLGKQEDGTVEVPPGDADSPAGWYENSPTPGEVGSSVILGHVNSTQTGVGVFYRLHELKAADQVSVAREDGTAAVFEVYRVDTYDKEKFPTVEVYGYVDRAELRLITCGGYDPSDGEFDQNIVVYAYLVSSHPA